MFSRINDENACDSSAEENDTSTVEEEWDPHAQTVFRSASVVQCGQTEALHHEFSALEAAVGGPSLPMPPPMRPQLQTARRQQHTTPSTRGSSRLANQDNRSFGGAASSIDIGEDSESEDEDLEADRLMRRSAAIDGISVNLRCDAAACVLEPCMVVPPVLSRQKVSVAVPSSSILSIKARMIPQCPPPHLHFK